MPINNYPRYGVISSVFVDEKSNDILLNVIVGQNQEPRNMRYSTPKNGMWIVPSAGEQVEVHEINGAFVAKDPVNTTENAFPEGLGEGDVCLKFNEDTQLYFSKQDDDSFDLEVTTDGDIAVSSTSGNIDVDSPAGSVTINGIDWETHVHPYSDKTISDTGDGSGTASDTSRTTDGPGNP